MTVTSLSSALSGLKAAQKSLDVISSNIANAGVEGYTRKILPQEALVAISGEPLGVRMQAIVRRVDAVLLRDLSKQVSVAGGTLVTQKYLDRIQDLNGTTENAQSVSAKLSALASAFTELSGAPDNPLSLDKTLTQAQMTADKFNDFSRLITQMRNEAETEIVSNLATVNASLRNIAALNVRINTLSGSGQSIASLEDQRDMEIRTVSQYIQVSTFKAENNKVTVMTRQGQTLADENARTVSFQTSNILPTSYYAPPPALPGSGGAHGLFVDDNEITNAGVGGAIGALLDLRDDILPTYTAQIDELAQKVAFRFDQEGLRLFTDVDGSVPANVADPGLVGYVGFAARIQVNEDVLNDPTLIRSGTNGNTVLPGSNEVIRKIVTHTFGPYAYEQATGTADISAGTIFAATGMELVNKIVGTATITGPDYQPVLSAHPDIAALAQFTITAGGPVIPIVIGPGDTALDLVNNINAGAGFPLASLNGLGQLVLDAPADIDISDVTLGAAGIAALGFSFGNNVAQNPSFTVQVGTQSPVTVSINPGDGQANLLASLNAIAGLSASLNIAGQLVLTPTEGGDIRLLNAVGTPVTDLGMVTVNVAHTPFRTGNLGPDGGVSTGLLGNATLEDFSRSVMTTQAEDSRAMDIEVEKEQSYLQILDKRKSDDSGVNIDEEMADMIRIQSNFAASAKVISATERMLDDLLNALR